MLKVIVLLAALAIPTIAEAEEAGSCRDFAKFCNKSYGNADSCRSQEYGIIKGYILAYDIYVNTGSIDPKLLGNCSKNGRLKSNQIPKDLHEHFLLEAKKNPTSPIEFCVIMAFYAAAPCLD